MTQSIHSLATQYKQALLHDVVPFWMKHSPDKEFGGYFSCLNRQGQVYDTDKFIWLQGRQAWLFSMLYNQVEQKPEWLDMARLGIDFLTRHGRNEQGHWYFSLNRQGQPLVQPYNIFSDCFAAMALGQYARATHNNEASQLAIDTYHHILQRQENPKGPYNKLVPGTRPLRSFALPMILSNLVLELEHLLDADTVQQTIDRAVHEVMEVFLDPQRHLIFEHRNADGSFSDTFDGRLTNPGHGLEAMWFMMDIAVRNNNPKLLNQAADMVLHLLDWGWDTQHGGIFYFLDALGKPPQQLEWDQKLWWVHLEALVALAKAYALTGREVFRQRYQQVHDYAWHHFPDPKHGEWFGYLNRQGEPFLQLKGGKWKGAFHLPRALYQNWQLFENLANQ